MTAEPTVSAAPKARRRPRRPSKAMVEDLTRWALYASHEPLWDTTSAGRHRRPGRPLRLTPDVALKFLTCVRLGNYRETEVTYIRRERDWLAHAIAEGRIEGPAAKLPIPVEKPAAAANP